MANYQVTIFATAGFGSEPGQTTWNGIGGTTTANAVELSPGDTVEFKKLGNAGQTSPWEILMFFKQRCICLGQLAFTNA